MTEPPKHISDEMAAVQVALMDLEQTPIPLWSYPLPRHVLEDWPLLTNLVRVTRAYSRRMGSSGAWRVGDWSQAIGLCKIHNATLVVNWSPFQPVDNYVNPGEDPKHAAEALDYRFFRALSEALKEYSSIMSLVPADMTVALVIDFEGFGVTNDAPLTRKLNIMYDALKAVRPATTIVWYNQYHTHATMDQVNAVNPWFPGVKNDKLGYCSLYLGADLGGHRAIVDNTWATAHGYGMAGLVAAVSLGSCWRRTPWTLKGESKRVWNQAAPCDLGTTWQLGAFIGQSWYHGNTQEGHPRANRYGHWGKIKAGHLYPPPFTETIEGFGPQFLAFIKGMLNVPLGGTNDEVVEPMEDVPDE